MNFQITKYMTPLRVLIVNPLVPASQLLITKIMSGIVFGRNQLIDLILLVYENEMYTAKVYTQELASCAFPCFNSIRHTSDLPCISDADVFCFISNFPNPNHLDFEGLDSDEQFDTFYLLLKIANNLGKTTVVEYKKMSDEKQTTETEEVKLIRKPIIFGDGLVVIDILWSFSKDLPPDIFFCSTPLRSISKTVLGNYLKVQCSEFNSVFVWGADDQVFHVEVERPYFINDKVNMESSCNWDAISKKKLESLNLDHTQFNASWMKREYIVKVTDFASTNPYGCIYKAAEMSKTLNKIWKSRAAEDAIECRTSLGIISDGLLGTVKGLPYVLPVIFNGDTWVVNHLFEETSHVRHEIKRINVTAKKNHGKLLSYCKQFLKENVIKKAFIPVTTDDESETPNFSSSEERSQSQTDSLNPSD